MEIKQLEHSLAQLSTSELATLAKLALLFNSEIDTQRLVVSSLGYLNAELKTDAITVFIADHQSRELTFWAVDGGSTTNLSGQRIPIDAGIVGWVIQNKKSCIVNDVKNDHRFFEALTRDTNFSPERLICVPLITRGTEVIGALQVINCEKTFSFSDNHLVFLQQFAMQLALAIENSRLHFYSQELTKKLEVLDQRKNEMISVIAHEFRTPLNLIQLGTDLLTSEDLDQESKENIVQTLSSGIDRLTRLVGQIRQVTLTTARTLPINKSTVNLKKLIEQVLNDFMPEKTGRKLSIKVDLESKIENVLADQTLIHIALKNLISNAIRFTPDNGTITISTKISAARAEISVSDTGIGISESQQKIIFEKFYEVTDSLKHSSGNLTFMSCGLGLGLSAVKAILEAHSSNVLVKSEVENGSTFSFRLELANQNLSTVKPENNCTSDVKGRVCSDDNSDKKRKR